MRGWRNCGCDARSSTFPKGHGTFSSVSTRVREPIYLAVRLEIGLDERREGGRENSGCYKHTTGTKHTVDLGHLNRKRGMEEECVRDKEEEKRCEKEGVQKGRQRERKIVREREGT